MNIFFFFFLEASNLLLKYVKQGILNVQLWGAMHPIFISSYTTWSQMLLSGDLFWFNFLADFIDAKLVSTHKIGKTFYMLLIRSFLTFHPLWGFVVQSKPAKAAEMFIILKFFFFDLEISKVLLKFVKLLILHVWGAMKQEIVNLYQLLWHGVPVFNLRYSLLSIVQHSWKLFLIGQLQFCCRGLTLSGTVQGQQSVY